MLRMSTRLQRVLVVHNGPLTVSLQDFIKTGAVTAHHCLKCISLAPYYAAQMQCCTEKWDKHNDQGPGLEVVDTCWQLIGAVGTGLYHSMADVQMMVSAVLALDGSSVVLISFLNIFREGC